jgi:RNA polymerase sigma-70 factor (ECF subfamily)
VSNAGVRDDRATPLEDEALAGRAAARDADAWSVIFERHYPGVFAFIRYRLHDAGTAEDLASQVFETAYVNAGRFDWQGAPIQAWLIGIARNVVRDHIKKQIRRGPSLELDETFAPPAPDEIGASDLRSDLIEAMRHLTEDQQTVLQLRFLLDRSVAETAMMMERSEDAVKNLQRRALAAMGRVLDEPASVAPVTRERVIGEAVIGEPVIGEAGEPVIWERTRRGGDRE